MKTLWSFLFLMYFLPIQLFAQFDIISPLSFSRVGTSSWGSGGVHAVGYGSSTSPIENPALVHVENISLYAEFGKRDEVTYLADFKFDGQYLLPSYASVTLPYDDFTLAAGYAQTYTYQTKSPDIPITTVENPDGTGDYASFRSQRTVHTIFISSSYSISDFISIGITGGVNIAVYRDELWHTYVEGNGTGVLVTAGLYSEPVSSLYIGASAQYANDISLSYQTNSNILFRVDDTGNNSTRSASYASPVMIATFPLRINAGLEYTPVCNGVSIMGGVEILRRNQSGGSVGSTEKMNGVNKHFGVVVPLIDRLKLRTGFFTEDLTADDNSYYSFDQQFFTAGVEWNLFADVLFTGTVIKCIEHDRKDFRQDCYMAGIEYRL